MVWKTDRSCVTHDRFRYPDILSVCQTVRSTKCSFDKVSVGKISLRQNVFRQNVFRQSVFRQNVRQPSISNEAVLFIRDEAGDMVVEIVAYTTLKYLAYVGQRWDLTIVLPNSLDLFLWTCVILADFHSVGNRPQLKELLKRAHRLSPICS